MSLGSNGSTSTRQQDVWREGRGVGAWEWGGSRAGECEE